MVKARIKALFYSHGYEICFKGISRVEHLWAIRRGLDRREAKIVFDVGANRGQTLTCFYPFFKNARFYCFEPDPEPFTSLIEIARPLHRASIFNLAFGASNEEKTLYVNQASEGNSLLQVSPHIVDTPGWLTRKCEKQTSVYTLDRFCHENEIEQIDLLKLDTQGYEANILKGATDLLSRQSIRVIFSEVLFSQYYQGQAYFEDIYTLLKSYGYYLVDLFQKSQRRDGALFSADALFIC